MRGIAWIVVAVCLAPGCFETPQEVQDDIVCGHVCNCVQVVDCQAQCLGLVAPVSTDCFDMVSANAQDCSQVTAAIMTGGVCRPDIPDPGPGP